MTMGTYNAYKMEICALVRQGVRCSKFNWNEKKKKTAGKKTKKKNAVMTIKVVNKRF